MKVFDFDWIGNLKICHRLRSIQVLLQVNVKLTSLSPCICLKTFQACITNYKSLTTT